MNFSIIIVNYNTSEYVDRLINSIYLNVKSGDFEIIVVDNNSSDRSVELLKSKYTDINLVLLKENKGFSAGNNEGVSKSSGDVIIFLNPDTFLEHDCITPLVNQINVNNKIGIISCFLKYDDHTYQSAYGRYRGIVYELLDALYITRYLYILNKKIFMFLREKLSKPFRVNWTSGAFMIMKKETFTKVNGFDDSYPLNYEDMDLCKKVIECGYEIYIDPRYYCIHSESKSQKNNFYNFVYKRYLGRLLYIKKFMRPFEIKLIIFIHIIGLYLRSFFLFLKSDPNEKQERKRAFDNCLSMYLLELKK